MTRPNGGFHRADSELRLALSGQRRSLDRSYPSPIRPRPDDVRADGAIEMKFPWWRGLAGRLRIEGRRLDAIAPPLSAWIPGGYGRKGFQSTAITFPTAWCAGHGTFAGASLTFVSLT